MSEQKSVILTAVLTAVITGIFTVLAGLSVYWYTSKEPKLSYSISTSPTLPSQRGTKRIYVIEVRNTGKKEVSQILAEVKLHDAQIQDIASEASPGVQFKEESHSDIYSITTSMLNPDEYFKISLLLLGNEVINPDITVRAPGIHGTLISPSESKSMPKEEPLPAIVAAGVFFSITSILLLSKLRAITGSLKQKEIVSYILGKCNLTEDMNLFFFSNSDISFRGAADFLANKGLQSNENKKRYIAALQSILLIKGIRIESILSIKRNLMVLCGDGYDAAYIDSLINKSIYEGNNPGKLRDAIDNHINSSLH